VYGLNSYGSPIRVFQRFSILKCHSLDHIGQTNIPEYLFQFFPTYCPSLNIVCIRLSRVTQPFGTSCAVSVRRELGLDRIGGTQRLPVCWGNGIKRQEYALILGPAPGCCGILRLLDFEKLPKRQFHGLLRNCLARHSGMRPQSSASSGHAAGPPLIENARPSLVPTTDFEDLQGHEPNPSLNLALLWKPLRMNTAWSHSSCSPANSALRPAPSLAGPGQSGGSKADHVCQLFSSNSTGFAFRKSLSHGGISPFVEVIVWAQPFQPETPLLFNSSVRYFLNIPFEICPTQTRAKYM